MTKLIEREDVRAFIHGQIADFLLQCTPKQVDLFARVFPQWPDAMTTDNLQSAIDLCERTTAACAVLLKGGEK